MPKCNSALGVSILAPSRVIYELFLGWVFIWLEISIVLDFFLLHENISLNSSTWAFVTRACMPAGMLDERMRSPATRRAPIFMQLIFRESGWSPNLCREGFNLHLKMFVDWLAPCLLPSSFVISEDRLYSFPFHLMMEVMSVYRGYWSSTISCHGLCLYTWLRAQSWSTTVNTHIYIYTYTYTYLPTYTHTHIHTYIYNIYMYISLSYHLPDLHFWHSGETLIVLNTFTWHIFHACYTWHTFKNYWSKFW